MDSSRRAPVRSSTPRAARLAGILLVSTLGLGSARAQYAYEYDAVMPARAVLWRLSDRGFTEITRPRFDGRAYVVEASSPYGDRVRLFVDARDGAILGRQRLGEPVVPPPARIVRPAPGYGWTEEDVEPRRPIREAERMMPPADIPSMPGSPRRPRIEANVPPPSRSQGADRDPTGSPTGNPLGMNPDAKGRPDAPRKVVRLTPAPKAAPRGTSDSPKLADTPPAAKTDSPKTDTRKPESQQPAAALEAPKTATSTIPAPSPIPATSPTPAAIQPPPVEKSAAKDWKDPPADQKRTVRVIGGATVVPGTNARDESAKE